MRKTNGEPYTWRHVSTVRGQAPGNLPSQGGKAPGAEPTIFSHTACNLPFKRLWISSLTDTAIREGLANLRDGSEYDKLFLAADCRAKADWLIGINASQALAVATCIGNNSLGRVQTPTLALIFSRYRENRGHVPSDYWELIAVLEKDGATRKFSYAGYIRTKQDADVLHKRVAGRALYGCRRRAASPFSRGCNPD